MKKKLGLLFALMITMFLSACEEVEFGLATIDGFAPTTIDGFVVTTTVKQFIDQGEYSLNDHRLAELLPDSNRDVQAQNFTFYLELVDMQFDDEETFEVHIPMPESDIVVIDTEGTATFEEITFYQAGIYTFKIHQSLELIANESLDEDVEVGIEPIYNWEADDSHFFIVVIVTEDEEYGVLHASVQLHEDVVFVNEFTLYIEEILASLHWSLTYDEVEFEMYSEYALLINLSDGLILFEHQADVRTFPASVTKMMTVLVGLENGDMNESVTVEADFDRLLIAEASQSGFVYDEVRTFSEILHGIMLSSGGEATEALANHVAGSYEAFVDLMNMKARELGMYDTHFVTATGLHDENHYTTANDIAILLQYALEIPEFREMFTRESYELETPNSLGDTLYSTLFKFAPTIEFEGGEIIGGRTGFTTPAGHCLASLATNGEEEFILITFGALEDDTHRIAHILDALMIYEYFISSTEN